MSNTGVNIPDFGSTGGATEATLLAVLGKLTGSKRDPELIIATLDGSTPDNVQSMSVYFDGTGGTFDGKAVNDGWVGSYTPNKGDDTVATKPFTVPTAGAGKVFIAYVDL